jgi:hypothetical protein
MIRLISNQLVFKARSLEPRKAISILAYHDDLRSFAQIAISIPNWCKGLTSDHMHGQRTNAYKSIKDSQLTSLTISYTFYMPSPCTNQLEGLDRCSIQHLLLSARTSPRTKSNGLPIDAPINFYYFHYTHHHVQKARGSIGMHSRFSIWLAKFSKSFCSSADIIIDGLARPLTPQARLLVFIEMQGSKWAQDRHLSWSGMSTSIDS